jgi:hypothetical protein
MSREAEIHAAMVYLAQARHFRMRGDRFANVLLRWAADARKRAAGFIATERRQGTLWGDE